ncbi:MAG: hypothetical protein MJ196_05870 [Treponemataceae bacterium]|nr:hypothetical protein [Treponemataceae bacterium]
MSAKKYNSLLASGLLFIFIGFVLLAAKFADRGPSLFLTYPAILMFLGGILLYIDITKFKRAIPLFVGIMLLLCGFLILLVNLNIFNIGMYQLWPLFVIFSGIALIITGFFRYKRLVGAIFVPTILLFVMGGFFLLFSLDIISVSFRVFALQWWPMLFVLAGIGLVILFLYTQGSQKSIMESGEEEFDEFI